MPKSMRLSDDLSQLSTAATAQNMADAVTYLMRVSDQAGMHAITDGLSAVRGKLLQIETEEWSQSDKTNGRSDEGSEQ